MQRKRSYADSKSQIVPIALMQEYTALETLGLSGKYMILCFLEKAALLTPPILRHEWRNLQFKVDSQRQIFEKLFMAILFALRVFTRNLLRGSRRRNVFTFRFDV